MTRFILIRHALTDTAGVKLTGRAPGVLLNEQGRLQAAELPELFKDQNIAAVFSSPLERAIETANPIARSLNLPVGISENFNEIDFGDWTNKTVSELTPDPVFRKFNSFRSGTRIPGGETMQEAQTRIVNGIDSLKSKYNNSTVAIVSHSDIIKSVIAWYAAIPLDMMCRIEISPASISIVVIHEDSPKIVLVNSSAKMGGSFIL